MVRYSHLASLVLPRLPAQLRSGKLWLKQQVSLKDRKLDTETCAQQLHVVVQFERILQSTRALKQRRRRPHTAYGIADIGTLVCDSDNGTFSFKFFQ